MRTRVISTLALATFATAAVAADGVKVSRGEDATVFGNCVPSLTVENRSGETIDYLQVDLVLSLANGQQRIVELQSAYRDGVPFPIAPGGRAILKQHLDVSMPTGVSCAEIKSRAVSRTVCEGPGGTACASQVTVQP